jgi:uncharacterized membrane protein
MFAQVNLSESFLRTPSIIWGTLTLLVVFHYANKLTSQRVALLTTLLLTLSPIHIQYSQEARFYASLLFFYILASWLLFEAIKKPNKRNWILFTVVTIIGIYFHVYVVLCIINGVGWLLISSAKGEQRDKGRLYFIRSSIFILLAFLVSILAFGTVFTYNIPLLLYETSLWNPIGTGLGFIPFYSSSYQASWVFGLLIFLLTGIGVILTIYAKPKSVKSVLIYSGIIQGVMIVVLNMLKSYFLTPRQFLIFLPIALIFAAIGVDSLIDKWKRIFLYPSITQSLGSTREMLRLRITWFILVGVLVVASVPAIGNYYQGDKGKTREILNTIIQHAQPNDPVFFIPDFQSTQFYYYTFLQPSTKPVQLDLVPSSWDTIREDIDGVDGNQFLVTDLTFGDSEKTILRDLGFEPLYNPLKIHRYSLVLWVRMAGTRID